MDKLIIMEVENGTKIIKEELDISQSTNSDKISAYARFFDETCPGWTKDSEHNLMFIRQQELYANDLLKSRGYLFLNEVYDMLGVPRSKAGQVVGWVYDLENPNGDNYVSFNICNPVNKNFINGYERNVLLDFNVDGMIFDKVL